MSNYKNFIQDFPIRCGEILETYRKQTEQSGREVTYMLAIAATALLIPFERLRKSPDGIKHPARDKEKYEQATGKFSNLCDKNFLESCLWQAEVGSWQIGEVQAEDVRREPEVWAQCSQRLPADVRVRVILEHVRNALAHGNIFTLPDKSDQINGIIFLSRIMDDCCFTDKYKLLTVSPGDFNEFLVKWIGFLKNELKLPTEVV